MGTSKNTWCWGVDNECWLFVAGKWELSSSLLTPYFVLGRLGGLATPCSTLDDEMFSLSAPSIFLEGKKTMDVERKWPKIADINLQIPKRCHAIWMVHWCRCNLLMTYHQQQHEINFQAQRVQLRDFESLPSTGKPMIFYQIPGPKFFFDL